jgi:hypothetical protein
LRASETVLPQLLEATGHFFSKMLGRRRLLRGRIIELRLDCLPQSVSVSAGFLAHPCDALIQLRTDHSGPVVDPLNAIVESPAEFFDFGPESLTE